MAAIVAYIFGMASSSRLTAKDVQRIEETVRSHPLPPFVTGFDVEYGDDYSGDPALWVLFKLKDGGVPITPRLEEVQPQMDEMNRLVSAVRSVLFDLFPDRWPYFRFVPSSLDTETDRC